MKKFINRWLLGFPLGLAIGQVISIITSLVVGKGIYIFVVPEFAAYFSNELNAVIAQTLLCGILGANFAAASALFEIESWSFTKMTIVHFIVVTLTMFPIAYISGWIGNRLIDYIIYIGIFILIYIIIWISIYFYWKNKVGEINSKLQKSKHN